MAFQISHISERIYQCDNRGTDPDMEKLELGMPLFPKQETLVNSYGLEKSNSFKYV